MASPSSSADKLPLSAVTASVASGLLAVWGLRQRQRRLVEQQQQQRQRSRSDHRNGQEPQQEPQQQQEEEEERPSSPPSSRQLRPGQRQWAALEGESPEEAEAAAPLATPSKPQRSSRRKGAEDGGPPSTPRHASSAKSRPPSTVPKLQAARDAAIEAAAAAAAAGSATAGDSSSASSTPTHHGRPPPKQGQGQQGESTAARVSRSLSEGPLPEVQERVLAALAACPGMAGVGNRRIELLVHNLSHKDMVLSLAPLSTSSKKEEAQGKPQQQQQEQQQQEAPRRMSSATSEELVLCRPKFSLFQPVSEALLGAVAGAGEGPGGEPAGTATFPVYTREEEGGWGEEGAGAVVGSMPDTVSVSSPRSESHPDRPSPPRRERAYTLRRQAPSAPGLPVGFDLSSRPLPIQDLADFRIRRDDARKLRTRAAQRGAAGEAEGEEGGGGVGVDGVYFPLLATVLPKWRVVVHGGAALLPPAPPLLVPPMPQQHPQVFKIVFLVSGVGMPRDPTSSATGNSTEGTARLIEAFIMRHYPDVAVVRVHSTTNIFRYDENIAFVKTELLPLIEYYRDGAAERWGTGWRHRYRITISFADGSPARIAAIHAALRPYRPSFMHAWELKTFWHHAKMCLDDVEVHSFEDIDTAPPVPLAAADARAQLVAQEMLRFKQEVLAHFHGGRCGDLTGFWLRKTQKPVLAVLLVQKPGGDPVLYRGCNMEVSMPTGSLCAERNAIGSALAADLTLRRRDLKIVAVLSLSFKPPTAATAAAAAAATEPVLRPRALDGAFAAAGGGPRTNAQEKENGAALPARLLLTAAAAKLGGGEAAQQGQEEGGGNGGGEEGAAAAAPSSPRVTVIRSYSVKDLHHHLGGAHHGTHSGPASRRGSLDVAYPSVHAPLSQPPLLAAAASDEPPQGQQQQQQQQQQPPLVAAGSSAVSHSHGNGHTHHQHQHQHHQQMPGTLTIAVDSEDLNPLKPCGACMEWLKKIAEKNPEFRVATFTDEACRGIYTEFISTS